MVLGLLSPTQKHSFQNSSENLVHILVSHLCRTVDVLVPALVLCPRSIPDEVDQREKIS
jgi:hypothetical protein